MRVAVVAAAVLLLVQPGNGLRLPSPWSRLRPSSLPDHQDTEITEVPYFDGELPSRQFGGYITVDEDRGRKL